MTGERHLENPKMKFKKLKKKVKGFFNMKIMFCVSLNFVGFPKKKKTNTLKTSPSKENFKTEQKFLFESLRRGGVL